MKTIEKPEIFRKNIVNEFNTKFLEDDVLSINLEKGIFNYSLKEAERNKVVKKWTNPYFVEIYIDRLKSIITNMKKKSIIIQLKNKEITPQRLAFMTHQEMEPERWEKLINAKVKRDKNKYESKIQAATDTFQCRKCHKNEYTYYQMQTRSADEPMTTFVTCINCGNRWRC